MSKEPTSNLLFQLVIELIIEIERRSRKEVFQPHLPVRLPCYDLAPITSFALGRSLRSRTLGRSEERRVGKECC